MGEIVEVSIAPLTAGDVLIHKLIDGRYALYGKEDGTGELLFYRHAESLEAAAGAAFANLGQGRKRWYSDWANPDSVESFR